MSTADDSDEQTPPGVTGIRRVPPIAPLPIDDRHRLMRMPKNAPSKERNTIVLPEMDLGGDLDAIRRGACWYDASMRRVWVNGRLYGQHDTGQLFPMRGEGFVELDRQTYRALVTFREYNGVNDGSLHRISKNPHISNEQRDMAVRIWRIRERFKREQSQS